ncbi:Receptor-like protein kinase [Quillaja saponaria]|uniref:Receptor-like protein kinase n=1 Tax=Quillaja saponaria TaxID=32244 RepID=A0AAD7LGE2_QUISA|nr:Receptor-like protein kinase [Quillaja saponaria]
MYVLRENNTKFNLTSDKGSSTGQLYFRATLDLDVVFTVYSHPKASFANESWTAFLLLPNNICNPVFTKTIGPCGFNSICTLDYKRPVCKCLTGYSLIDSNDQCGSCKPDFLQGCEEDKLSATKDLYKFEKKLKRYQRIPDRFGDTNLHCFTYEELEKATNGFKEELGRGAFGIVYKGAINMSSTALMAVKRLTTIVQVDGDKEFKNEVNVIGHTYHKNLVRLRGFSEWFRNMPITAKVDVYSFGVLLLEIVCCRRSIDMESHFEEQVILTDWAYDYYKEGTLEALVGKFDEEALNDKKKLERLVMVALWCIQEDPSLRPTMRKVIQMLEGVVEVLVPPCPYPYTTV